MLDTFNLLIVTLLAIPALTIIAATVRAKANLQARGWLSAYIELSVFFLIPFVYALALIAALIGFFLSSQNNGMWFVVCGGIALFGIELWIINRLWFK
jgi:hypothetical protein